MKLLTCKEASAAMSRQHEHPLPFTEKLGLRLHLYLCAGCRNFQNNIRIIRAAMQRYLDQGRDR